MQDAPSIKFWGPYFDGFVNISIFMILGVFGGSLARWDICLMYGIFVSCMGYLSCVWGISLMYGIFVLCFGKNKITCHPGATMAECIVLCMGY